MEKIKKTWVTESSFDEIKELCKSCEDQEFVKFIKQHHKLSIPTHYFTKFCWIKFRFDDLFYEWNNSQNPKEHLLEYFKIEKTYPDYYNEEEDCLDFGDWDPSSGTVNVPIHSSSNTTGELSYLKMKVFDSPSKFSKMKEKTSKSTNDNDQKRDPSLLVNSYQEVPLAMKCILWSLDNEPSTTGQLYSYIELIENGSKRKFTKEEYQNILNPIIDQAVKDKVLMLKKVPKDGKNLYLYYNASNKRTGYFFDGKLYSVPEISLKTGINENTLYYRLSRYDIYKAVTGV